MKKAVSMLLVLAMLCALCGCGKEKDAGAPASSEETATVRPEGEEPAETPGGAGSETTNGQTLLADFRARTDGGAPTAAELAEGIIGNEIIPFDGTTAEVEPGFLPGFTEEITGFAEGCSFGPMIGTIPFVGYIFQLEDGADVDAFMQNLKDKADLRWNICTAADEMVCDAAGNTVFFVMCQAQFEE